MDKNFLSLELDKILEKLSNEAYSCKAKEKILSIRPSDNLKEVNRLLGETSAAHMLTARFGAPSFYGVKDIVGSVRRAAAGATLTTIDLLNISATLSVMRTVKEWKKQSVTVDTCIDFRFDSINTNKYLEDKINNSIKSEEEFYDEASVELSNIRKKIRSINEKIRDRLDSMIKSVKYKKYLQDSIVTVRNDRFVIPVKAEYRAEVSGLVHDTSASGSTIFIEPVGVVTDNNEVRVLRSKEREEINRILNEISGEVGRFSEDIISSYSSLVELDVIFAKALLAYKMKASLPVVNEDGEIMLKKARHPMIKPSEVVPMDIELGVKFDTLIITGPNTGGKTVSLKIIGLFCAMTMCGLMIPAEDGSVVSTFSNVLVDVGDEQSIEQSLSTFSSHIKNIVTILNKCDDKSLVLLDEIGAGTDPVEGAALATSIIETLIEKGAKIAVTTHYKELKEYALKTSNVENGSCEFDVTTMKPTYKLILGVPGKSNAFLISERLGVDKKIIDRAKKFTSDDDNKLEKIICKLELTRQKLEQEYETAQKLKREAELLKLENEKVQKDIQQQKDSIIDSSRDKAKRILEEVRCRAEMVFEELDNLKMCKNTVSADKRGLLNSEIRDIESIADPIEKSSTNVQKKIVELSVGDTVFVADFNKEGEVLSNADSAGRILVQVGSIKTRVLRSHLSLVDSGNKKKHSTGRVTKSIKSRSSMKVSTEIDLRGQDILSATMELDGFIDTSVIAGIQRITIIHGKGTGRLRKGIHDYLKTHRQIKRYRLGNFGEGETGVTIVELK